MILDTNERAVMREMQARGEASFTRDTLEGIVQLGSTDVFNATVDSLIAKALVAEHRFSPQVPTQVTLTIAGRALKIEGDELPVPPPPPFDSTATDKQIVNAPTTLFGGPSLAEVFNVYPTDH